MSEIHSNLIRAVTLARLAYFIYIGGMAVAIRVIRIEAVVRDGQVQHSVTVDVDAV